MKTFYDEAGNVMIQAPSKEYNAIVFAVVNMVNSCTGKTQQEYKSMLSQMEQFYQEFIKNKNI